MKYQNLLSWISLNFLSSISIDGQDDHQPYDRQAMLTTYLACGPTYSQLKCLTVSQRGLLQKVQNLITKTTQAGVDGFSVIMVVQVTRQQFLQNSGGVERRNNHWLFSVTFHVVIPTTFLPLSAMTSSASICP
jgi:hypothetical protein